MEKDKLHKKKNVLTAKDINAESSDAINWTPNKPNLYSCPTATSLHTVRSPASAGSQPLTSVMSDQNLSFEPMSPTTAPGHVQSPRGTLPHKSNSQDLDPLCKGFMKVDSKQGLGRTESNTK